MPTITINGQRVDTRRKWRYFDGRDDDETSGFFSLTEGLQVVIHEGSEDLTLAWSSDHYMKIPCCKVAEDLHPDLVCDIETIRKATAR